MGIGSKGIGSEAICSQAISSKVIGAGATWAEATGERSAPGPAANGRGERPREVFGDDDGTDDRADLRRGHRP